MKYNTFKAIVLYTIILICVFTVITEAACASSNVRVEAEDADTIIPPMQVASASGMDYMPGRLRINTENPHYFEYEGEPVLLFGSGDWHIIYGQDGTRDYYKTELDAVSECGGNFIRMVAIDVWANANLDEPYPQSLYPWARNGGGTANDGLERFDLNIFNPEYWDKLKNVIAYAKSKNMVVLLQLLGETGIERGTGFPGTHNARWLIHPFNPSNNNNDLDLPSGDTNAVPEFYDLSNTKVIGCQEVYMAKMLDETSSYGNVIYELSNEYSDEMRTSTDPILWNWAKHWSDFFEKYEQIHSVELLFTNMQQWNLVDEHAGEPGFDLLDLYWARNDRWWGDLEPMEHINTILNDQWSTDKPLIFGRSVWSPYKQSADTAWKVRQEWWTEFTSGAAGATIKGSGETDTDILKIGDIIKYFHEFVDTVKFWEMAPHDEVVITGTGYCLANLGGEYVIYLPEGDSVTVDLSDASGILNVVWYNPKDGTYYDERLVFGGGRETFTPPFSGDAVLHIVSTVFDTNAGVYPSISGTHRGTIKTTDDIVVQKMYTYPCSGTGGHSEYVRIWNASGTLAEGNWSGYGGDWHTISFDKLFILRANETYNYTIRTGSYPQMIHVHTANVTGGTITCDEFVAANGKSYNDRIPAIKLYYNTNNSACNRLFKAWRSITRFYDYLVYVLK